MRSAGYTYHSESATIPPQYKTPGGSYELPPARHRRLSPVEPHDTVPTKFCPRCATHKPLSGFHKNRAKPDGVQGYCRPCFVTLNSDYARRHPDWSRNTHLRKTFGITVADRQRIVDAQGGRCAICADLFEGQYRSKCIDHDHETGQIRGILCRRCNIMLGHARDRVDILAAAISYLGDTLP